METSREDFRADASVTRKPPLSLVTSRPQPLPGWTRGPLSHPPSEKIPHRPQPELGRPGARPSSSDGRALPGAWTGGQGDRPSSFPRRRSRGTERETALAGALAQRGPRQPLIHPSIRPSIRPSGSAHTQPAAPLPTGEGAAVNTEWGAAHRWERPPLSEASLCSQGRQGLQRAGLGQGPLRPRQRQWEKTRPPAPRVSAGARQVPGTDAAAQRPLLATTVTAARPRSWRGA